MKKKYVIPGYIPPEEDEILSSWIFRLARSHKMKPFTFAKYGLEVPDLWNRDFDKFYNQKLIDVLTTLTPLSHCKITSLHLISYQDIIFNSKINSAFTEGILNVGVEHRMRNNKGLLACPLCLSKKQYYKKSWRLLSSIVCTDCRCNLIDECPDCKMPIVFQRLDIGKKDLYLEKPMYLCWNCNNDLRKDYTVIDKNSNSFKYQKYINNTIQDGFNKHTQYSFEYFNVLFSILRKSRSGSTKFFRLREAFSKEFGIKSEMFTAHKFELSLNLRRELLPLIYELLLDLNNNFVPFCKNHFIRFSDIRSDGVNLPFWIYDKFR